MVADILPLRALPRGLAFFSYTVPVELTGQILPGQCVKIPFRSSTMLGIVGKIFPQKNNPTLKSVLEIINPEPLIDQTYLDWLEKLAKFYGVSLATVLKSALPPLQPNKINQEVIKPWQNKNANSAQAEYAWYKNQTEHATALAQYESERILIIIPEIKFLPTVENCLSKARKANLEVWDSQASVKNERELWFKVRNGEVNTLVATRGALWWPISQSFDRVIIDFEHDENHKHWDQSPRFHTKDVAKLQAKWFGLKYTEMSFSPSVVSYFFIQEKKYTVTQKSELNFSAPTIVQPDSGQKNGPIYSPTLQAIKNALQTGNVLLIYNQTKPGKFGFCPDCQQSIPTPLPLTCPHCQNSRLIELGHTIKSVAKTLQAELPDVVVTTIDKENIALPESSEHHIIVGTYAALRLIKYDTISLAVILDFTRQALFADYLTHESLRHKIREFQFFLKPEAHLMIQSATAEHPLLSTLGADSAWYTAQLTERSSLSYPPYSYLVRYLVPGQGHNQALDIAKEAIYSFQTRLTKTPKKLTIQGPIMADNRHQNKDWAIVMVKITESDILESTLFSSQFFPSNTKIDPNPISLSSPH